MLVDLAPHRRRLAAMLAVAANLGGLGLGPLVAGAFAEWGGEPLRAPYILHLLLAGAAIGCIVAVPETVVDRRWRLRLNRLGVPADVRGVFVPAAVAGFCCFAAAGLFSSIAPEFLARVLHRPDHLLAGAVTALMFLTSVAGQVAVGRMPAGRALAGGCVALLAGVGAIAAALVGASLAVLVAAAVLVGLGQGVIVGAGLAAISLRTAAGLRGQVSSTFFVVSYVGLALPVIGVGEAADRIGLRTAGLGFAAAVAVVVAAVLVALAARAGAGAQTAG